MVDMNITVKPTATVFRLLALTSVTVVVYSDYTRASPYPAFPDKIQIIRLTRFRNLSANDEGRRLASR